jgi:hypothetical protein
MTVIMFVLLVLQTLITVFYSQKNLSIPVFFIYHCSRLFLLLRSPGIFNDANLILFFYR